MFWCGMEQIKFLEETLGKNKGFFCFYGESATGKTTAMKMGCIKKILEDKKVLFIDAERGFSIDRFAQLAGENYEDLLKNLFILKVKSFKDQQVKINNLAKLIESEKISLVVVDTISYYYRTLFRSKPDLARLMLKSQLRTLKEISKKILVLMTNQVYSKIDGDGVNAISGKTIEDYCDGVVRLERDPRKIFFEKPNEPEERFMISEVGIFQV